MAALAVAALTAGPAAGAGLQPRIVGGTFTSGFPSVVAVLEGGDPATAVATCTGTLIGCRTVVTAAHCVCGVGVPAARCAPRPGDFTVFLQHAGLFGVAAVAVHPAYGFPDADLALLRLVAPVDGVAPSPLATATPPPGTAATVVGFGRSGDPFQDYNLKRAGSVVTADCTPQALSNDTSVCFEYAGVGANTCNGDSGGPLFVEGVGGLVLAGVTSGGSSDDCLAGDASWDTSVAAFATWIAANAGDAVGVAACGTGPQAGGSGTTVAGMMGTLDATLVGVTHRIDVEPGAARLRVTLNGEDPPASPGQALADFDLLVAAGREPTAAAADCAAVQPNQYGVCEVAAPAAGPWYLRAVRRRGAGRYQLTATTFGAGAGGVAVCGNGVREAGEACDGADAGACPAGCTDACACTAVCASERVRVRRLVAGRWLAVSARLLDPDASLAGVDPTRSDLALVLDDGSTQVHVTVPANDPGWARSRPRRAVWRWRGRAGGLRAIRLRDRSAADGVWTVHVRGRDVAGTRTLHRRRAHVVLNVGGRCVAE